MKKINLKKENYSWDLEAILEGKTIEALFNELQSSCNSLVASYDNGNFIKSEKTFEKFLILKKKFKILTNRFHNYISNNLNEDINNSDWVNWYQKLIAFSSFVQQKLSGFNNEVIKNKLQIEKYLSLNKFKEYKRYFYSIFRFKSHSLKPNEEDLLAKLSPVENAIEDIFDTLTRSEIKFNDVLSKSKKAHKIKTMSDFNILLKSKDRILRKNAWVSKYDALYNYKNTLAKTLYQVYLKYNTYAKIRNFKNYVEETAFQDEINPNFIPFVYEQVAKYASLNKEYNSLIKSVIKKRIKVKNVEPWDMQAPLFNKKNKYTIEQTKEIAIKALSAMGQEYISNIKKAFNENWISWLPKPGKQTGAYSIGNAEGLSKYYISMNFDGTLRSVYTIVHELGHSMHTLKILQNQKLYTSVSIFYAEISSIANEMLLNNFLLKKYTNDPKMKVLILQEMINNFFATTTRQIMFSNFEYEVNHKINSGEQFGSETAFKIYADMHKKYLDYSDAKVKELLTKTNLRKSLSIILSVPHFYTGILYVYKYAIGQVAAIIATKRIINNESNALENFNRFLESGNSLPPLETISLLNVDLTTPQAWEEAKEIISGWIQELKIELKKIKLAK